MTLPSVRAITRTVHESLRCTFCNRLQTRHPIVANRMRAAAAPFDPAIHCDGKCAESSTMTGTIPDAPPSTHTIFDIETHGQARALEAPYPEGDRQPPSNYKNADAIERWFAADKLTWKASLAKNAALNPMFGRIVAVGVYLGAGDNRVGMAESHVDLDEANEHELVRIALDSITPGIVTYNGLDFDLPFLHFRAAVLGIPIPYRHSDFLRRYTTTPHSDLLAILRNWKPWPEADTNLPAMCRAFGIDVEDTTTGKDIGPMVDAGDVDGIRAHNLSDLHLAGTLAARMAHVNLIDAR